jgi:UDP-N-acetylmuramoyl-L-alanyl-D-glutamate--2,6-diaminopimelate ligase
MWMTLRRGLARELPDPITFALRQEAVYRALDVQSDLSGCRFGLQSPDGAVSCHTPLRGEFNVYNVLGALAAARALQVPIETALQTIATAGQVPETL